MVKPRTGQVTGEMTRADFSTHFRRRFFDPAFTTAATTITRLEAIA